MWFDLVAGGSGIAGEQLMTSAPLVAARLDWDLALATVDLERGGIQPMGHMEHTSPGVSRRSTRPGSRHPLAITHWGKNWWSGAAGGRGGSRSIPEQQPQGTAAAAVPPQCCRARGVLAPRDSLCWLGCPRARHTPPPDNTPKPAGTHGLPWVAARFLRSSTRVLHPCLCCRGDLPGCAPHKHTEHWLFSSLGKIGRKKKKSEKLSRTAAQWVPMQVFKKGQLTSHL